MVRGSNTVRGSTDFGLLGIVAGPGSVERQVALRGGRAAPGNRSQNSVNRVGWRINATNVTIQYAIGLLSIYAHRPILDKTGLTGHYDFKVKWLLDQTAADAAGSDLPTLPAALQEQLGLRLESTTAPFDTILIDHAEKPSEN